MDIVSDFPIHSLFFASVIIWLITFFAVKAAAKSIAAAIVLSLVKAMVFFLYFALIFDGNTVLNDDVSYLLGGQAILQGTLDITNPGSFLSQLMGMFGSRHILYYLYNAFAQLLFGFGYFAPVALNVSLLSVIAYLAFRLALILNFSTPFAKSLFYIVLLSINLNTWGYIFNLKDILVLFLSLSMLISILELENGLRFSTLLSLLFCVILLSFLRFYVPLLMLGAYLLYFILFKRGFFKKSLVLLGILLLFVANQGLILDGVSRLAGGVQNPLIGIVRFLITPLPWQIDPAYVILIPAAVIHMVLMPLVFLGFWGLLVMVKGKSKLLIVYFLTILVFYGSYEELQGPRQRLQVDVIFSLLAFHGFYTLLHKQSNSLYVDTLEVSRRGT